MQRTFLGPQRSALLLRRRVASPPAVRRTRSQPVPVRSSAAVDLPARSAGTALQASRPPTSRSSLKDPAHINASASASITLEDADNGCSVEQYMALPVEQYHELDPKLIRPLGGNRFSLAVPRIHILSIWVEPLVEVVVTRASAPDRVVIEAVNARIHGSDLVLKCELDRRFCLSFTTTLFLERSSPPVQLPGAAPQAASSATQAGARGVAPLGSASARPAGQWTVRGEARLDVWSEVVSPFHLMPRSALEASGSAVMRALTGSLLPLFMSRLAADYKRWASDENYRAARAQHGRPAGLTQRA